ncbi:LysR family transcriptional regulator [Blastococcus tunisiensis]|uniref:DNA-binding transcriptional regulator, LysR family n=1 Tax=Blastococcus tunisiensis TaxID=1798228 RepID=A0A1I2D342_9ACTN|nr:LysR family transcriptional regulator [Blastococcus sp. DSM 46838]SFE74914.1 DNA-binding transcriptional regulator, LysR family [Blastococcus sp. DSM 46838]
MDVRGSALWERVDVAHLAVLRELAEHGSVTAVARATTMSPSAVSQRLATLQRRLGVVLVERAGRGVRLTDAGRALAGIAASVSTALAAAEAEWQDYRGGVAGTVRLATFHSAGELLVPGLLDRLAAVPDILLETFDEDVSQDDFAGLTADYDIVVAHRSDDVLAPARGPVEVRPLLREPLDVALPLGHPLAGRSRVAPADVIDEDWIVPPAEFPLDRVLTAIAAQAGSPARVVRRTTHLPLMEKLVARGHGIALLPRHTTRDRAEGRLVLVPLADLRAGRVIEALMRPDRAARRAVQVVLDALVDEAAPYAA